MKVHATIDGLPVAITDWQCDSTVNHGYRSLSGKIPEAFTSAEQEAPVRLWLPNGDELWAGKLALDPITERGKRSISARGYAEDISADETRFFYRIDGGEGWVDADSDPHALASEGDYDLSTGPGFLKWKWANNADSFVSGEHAGFVLWVEGGEITRYSFLATNEPNFSNFDIIVRSFDGPSGSSTLVGTHSMSSSPNTRATTLGGGDVRDALWVRVQANAASTPGTRRKLALTQIKVYGLTNDDAYSAGEVVADVGTTVGFDVSHVQDNALAVLPIDWTEDNADLLTYMAALTDQHWEAYGPNLYFGPWETTWTGYATTGVNPTWENQPRYNQVAVPFTYISGRSGIRSVTADPDPFPGQNVTYTADVLEHPQQTSALALAVAGNMVEHYASRRVGGRLELGRVVDEAGRPTGGEEVRPGHLMVIPERADLGPQRVVGMNYRENGYPVAELNDDFNVIRLLNDIRVPRRRKRRRRGGR